MPPSLRIFLTIALLTTSLAAADKTPRRPSLILWAWERPTDLSFIDPNTTGVAYLESTIAIGRQVSISPRRQPLHIPPKTYLIAVVRIEARSANLSSDLIPELVTSLLRSAAKPEVRGLQIDFDALHSERDFYTELLQRLRRALPAEKTLSITALSSWCAGDDWIATLPIDEAVPMFFRLGPDRALFEREGLSLIREPRCTASVGVSTDERWPGGLRGHTLYVFNPSGWTRQSVADVMKRANR